MKFADKTLLYQIRDRVFDPKACETPGVSILIGR